MLVLFGIFLVVVDSVQGFLKTQHSAVSLHVYLRPDVAKQSSEQVASMLKGLRGVSSVTFVDPDQALVRLKHTLGEDSGLTLGVQDDNPLPPSYEVLFAQDVAEELAHYATQIERFDGVEAVVFDRGFFESVGELLRVVARVAWIGIPFLFVIVAFIIASTVRLSLHSHREEIQIMKLVGARSRYIRAPFLLAAVIQGMLGSMLALGLLLGLGALSEDAWRHSKFLSLAGEVPFSMSTWVGALVLISGVVVGFVASHVTLRRFLSER
jgi:cell division transport system permease protein